MINIQLVFVTWSKFRKMDVYSTDITIMPKLDTNSDKYISYESKYQPYIAG